MKFLLHSNGPRSGTGYGVQVALLADRLANDGHEVAISCTHGHDTGISHWLSPSGHKIRLYPRRTSPTGGDIIHGHANHWFEGDQRAGWIIPLIDMWAFRNPALKDYNVAAWTPVDHLEAPPGVLEFFSETRALPLAMSRHGQAALDRHGLDVAYIPLAVDTKVFRPTPELTVADRLFDAREYYKLPRNAFVVGVVAMNKGNVFDRKGFSEAFYAFAEFRSRHPEAVLFLHTDRFGFDGISLNLLAEDAGIPASALVFTDQYAYTIGLSSGLMAAAYTAMDVLLSPSHGEGFCVPLIEAQACGVPVIASDATAQAELVGAGWLVAGQRTWDESQRSPAFTPLVSSIVDALEAAFAADLVELQEPAREFAMRFDADAVYETYWRPFIAALKPDEPEADKPPMTDVAVVVPVMKRPWSVAPFVESFIASTEGEAATLYFVTDPDDDAEREAIEKQIAEHPTRIRMLTSHRGHTFAQKANTAYRETDESWLFICGDDCELTPGFIAAARVLSDRYDVIGTNDSEEGRIRNPDVANRRHADHWFTRRAYIDDEGSCLEGPGVFCPEAYYHWWVDREVIGLAQARGVFSPCMESRVIHHHPGFDGDEQARLDDPVYMKAVEWSERDKIKFAQRWPLIDQIRTARRAA